MKYLKYIIIFIAAIFTFSISGIPEYQNEIQQKQLADIEAQNMTTTNIYHNVYSEPTTQKEFEFTFNDILSTWYSTSNTAADQETINYTTTTVSKENLITTLNVQVASPFISTSVNVKAPNGETFSTAAYTTIDKKIESIETSSKSLKSTCTDVYKIGTSLDDTYVQDCDTNIDENAVLNLTQELLTQLPNIQAAAKE